MEATMVTTNRKRDNLSDKPQKLTLAVPVELSFDRDAPFGEWKVRLKFADTSPTVTDPDTGLELGELAGCVGGGMEFTSEVLRVTYFATPEALWEAFHAALLEQGIDIHDLSKE